MTVDFSSLPALLILALAVSAVSMTVTQGSIFASFRTWVAAKSKWFGDLFACFYCLSHWVAFTAVAVFRPRPLRSDFLLADLTVSAFTIIALAAIVSGLVFGVFLSAMAVHRAREAQQAKNAD